MNSTYTIYHKSLKKVLQLALPIIAGQLGQVLMGFFDTIQIGGMGAVYIAASGFANTVYWLTNLLGLGILFAVSPLVSEAFGEKKEWKAIGVLRSALKISLLVSLVLFAIMLLAINYIELFRQTEQINELSIRYLNIVNYSTIFILLFTTGKQFLDGMGRTIPGMLITLAGLALNVFLNWALIYGHAGFPAMGIEGAALATGIARIAMAVAILVYIWRDQQTITLRKLFGQHSEAQKSYILPILKIGIPSGLQFFMEVAAFSSGQIMSGWLGEKYLAAHQIAINLASVTFMVLMGFAAAGTIMTGYAFGARDRTGIRIAGNTVFLITLLVEIIFAGLFFSCHQFFPALYTADAEVIRLASSLLIFAAFFQISDGLQAAAAGALRGMQDVRIPVLIAFVSYWLVMIPGSYWLAFKLNLGINGLWIGFIGGLSVAAMLLLIRFYRKVKTIEFTEL
ncbi:MAG: MATE family efflux transporter [Chitinophagales bacterium]|nr:MATE family efflux transporter [Chitinophagales bacterium]